VVVCQAQSDVGDQAVFEGLPPQRTYLVERLLESEARKEGGRSMGRESVYILCTSATSRVLISAAGRCIL